MAASKREKWAKLIKDKKYEIVPFNKEQASDQKFKDAVAKAKLAAGSLSFQELMRSHEDQRLKREELEAELYATEVEFQALCQLIQDHFANDGVTSLHTDQGRNLVLKIEPCVSVEQPQSALQFFLDHPEHGVTLVPHHSSITTWVKGLLENDLEEQVPKFLKVYFKKSIESRKS